MGYIFDKFFRGVIIFFEDSKFDFFVFIYVVVFQDWVSGFGQVDGFIVADIEGFMFVLIGVFLLGFGYEIVFDLSVIVM